MTASLQMQADELARLLHDKGYGHLKVVARGKSLTVSAVHEGETDPRLRLRALGSDNFGVSFADHRGRFEPAPITGPLAAIVDQVCEQFGWLLEDGP